MSANANGKLHEWIVQGDEPGFFDTYTVYGDGRILNLAGRETYEHASGNSVETNPLDIADEAMAEICLPEIVSLVEQRDAARALLLAVRDSFDPGDEALQERLARALGEKQ